MCDICNLTPCDYRCPNYVPKKPIYHCVECDEPILDGEEFIMSPSGKTKHLQCFSVAEEVVRFLGEPILVVDDIL